MKQPIATTKITNFTNFAKRHLAKNNPEFGPALKNWPDIAILELLRHCTVCGKDGVHLTQSQQLHSILEFDTPEAVWEVCCETIRENTCNEEWRVARDS